LGLEGATIVVSILIAFFIDAWWDGRTQDQLILQQQTQLVAQLSANAEALRIAEADGARASEAMLVLVESIGPNPTLLTADSLASLLDRSFRIDPPALETGALEGILSQGDLAATIEAQVLGWLMTYRTVSETYAAEGIAWEATRTTLIEYVASIAPLSYVLDRERDESEFPFPVERLLSDPRLEGMIEHLSARSGRLRTRGRLLMEHTDSILGERR
jgi:hypothetical protein